MSGSAHLPSILGLHCVCHSRVPLARCSPLHTRVAACYWTQYWRTDTQPLPETPAARDPAPDLCRIDITTVGAVIQTLFFSFTLPLPEVSGIVAGLHQSSMTFHKAPRCVNRSRKYIEYTCIQMGVLERAYSCICYSCSATRHALIPSVSSCLCESWLLLPMISGSSIESCTYHHVFAYGISWTRLHSSPCRVTRNCFDSVHLLLDGNTCP